MTQEEYFNFKHDEAGRPVLSSSLLKNAMPMWGGNVARLNAAFNKELDKVESPEMRFGTLVHKYVEDHTRFVFKPEFEMSDTIKTIAEKTYNLVKDTGQERTDELRTHEREIHMVCEEVGWGQSWKAETRFTKFRDAAHGYWLFMREAEDKIVVTGNEVEKIQSVIKSVQLHGLQQPVLEDPVGKTTYREHAIRFDYQDLYSCKALIDILVVDDEKKVATGIDVKTTSGKSENFVAGYTYRPNPETGIIEKVSYSGDYIKYAYFFQENFYRKAIQAWLFQQDKEDYDVKFEFVVLETSKPFLSDLIRPNPAWMAIAQQEYEAAMNIVEQWFDTNKLDEF